jgi:hypothetical protein
MDFVRDERTEREWRQGGKEEQSKGTFHKSHPSQASNSPNPS